ncbi:MAG: glycosyltransferase family 39 protein [Asticcacaulis sp.]|nr:glycosyltransferase family 39 protein [Asticcacaulis sp.]
MSRFIPQQLVRFASGGMRGPLLAALLTIICALPLLFVMPPIDRDESRFAQATSQMLETHDFININYQDTPRHKKPVGIHWLQAASVALTSKVEARSIAAYRWPSLLGAALAAFACAWGASRAFGTRIGTRAGLLFGVTFMLSTEAFFAKTDAVLCGLITLAMVALSQIYLRTRDLDRHAPNPKILKEKLIFWLSLAAAILVKGPVPLLVMGLTLAALWGFDRKINWAKRLGWLSGLILILLICGPWAVAITITTDGKFWMSSIGGDLASKLDSGSEGHFMWPGYHTLLLAATMFPASWLFGGALQAAMQRRAEPAIRFAIAWFLPTFVFFELMPTKLPHYPLPAFGALAWLCAVSLDMPLKRWAHVMNWIFGIFGGVFFTSVAIYGCVTFGAGVSLPLAVLTAISALGLGIFAGWLLLRGHGRAGFSFLLAAGVLCHLGVWTLAASLKPLWLSRQMEQALMTSHLDPRLGVAPGPVATLGYAEPSFVFTMGTKTELCNEDADEAASALAEGRPVFVEAKMDAAFQTAAAAHGLTPHVVARISGHNYNGGDQTLVLYDNPPPITAQ